MRGTFFHLALYLLGLLATNLGEIFWGSLIRQSSRLCDVVALILDLRIFRPVAVLFIELSRRLINYSYGM